MKISPELKMRFRNYVEDISEARANLAFLLDNLCVQIEPDFSRRSLEALESGFWRLRDKIPANITNESQFVQLMAQYLADCIIRRTGAKWRAVDRTKSDIRTAGFGWIRKPRVGLRLLRRSRKRIHRVEPHQPEFSWTVGSNCSCAGL